MNLNFRRMLSTASAVAVLIGIGAAALAAPASAQSARPWPHAVTPAQTVAQTTAPTATPFDLNGAYKDNGSARPRITRTNDVLTIDLSSQNRPPATGLVFDDHTILVIFPDISAWFRGTLVAPGTILWNNGTIWQKLPYVPNVLGLLAKGASPILTAAGFTVATQQQLPSCGSQPGVVIQQIPGANTQADPGSKVTIKISNC
jgi:hypothetical protein